MAARDMWAGKPDPQDRIEETLLKIWYQLYSESSAVSGGDATAANQTAVQANPGSDAAKAVAVQGVTGGKDIPISASSLPLPTGAATQTTLAALLAKFNAEPVATFAAIGASASGNIPATAKSWSFVLLTGSGTIGGATLPLGMPLSGGTGFAPIDSAIAYTTNASSSAFLFYEE